ncbi:MAG: serine--tRNA ligase [bacterium]|nr:serine--tRNA ligase [bacterium]
MIDIKLIRENPDLVRNGLRLRGAAEDSLKDLFVLERKRRSLIQQVDELRSKRNILQEEINKAEACKKSAIIDQTKEISARIKEIDAELSEKEEGFSNIILQLPNIPHSTVPSGKDSQSNQEIKRWGKRPEFSFKPKPHWELGEALKILDPKRATKITGSRFSLFMGIGARLERGLINFMLDLHTKEHGYKEVSPPFLVNSETMTGTGQLPKFADDLFRCAETDYWLIPTAEVPLTNIHRDEILQVDDLPLLYTAYTPCFRKEAGTYGKESRGLIRQHQFDKVELVRLTRPEDSYSHLERLLLDAEEVLKRLNLAYRVMALCTGDLGFSASKTYDLEVWMPGLDAFVEISSCSNFEDFQARRCGMKYRPESSAKPEYLHTLNGSGLAIGRTVAAILENFQEEDGTIKIPEALYPYMGERVIYTENKLSLQ